MNTDQTKKGKLGFLKSVRIREDQWQKNSRGFVRIGRSDDKTVSERIDVDRRLNSLKKGLNS